MGGPAYYDANSIAYIEITQVKDELEHNGGLAGSA
jgi:hypothetical protein